MPPLPSTRSTTYLPATTSPAHVSPRPPATVILVRPYHVRRRPATPSRAIAKAPFDEREDRGVARRVLPGELELSSTALRSSTLRVGYGRGRRVRALCAEQLRTAQMTFAQASTQVLAKEHDAARDERRGRPQERQRRAAIDEVGQHAHERRRLAAVGVREGALERHEPDPESRRDRLAHKTHGIYDQHGTRSQRLDATRPFERPAAHALEDYGIVADQIVPDARCPASLEVRRRGEQRELRVDDLTADER